MDARAVLDAQIDEMERELIGDDSLPDHVKAYFYLRAARRLMGDAPSPAPRAALQRMVHGGEGAWVSPGPMIPSRGQGKINRGVDPNRVKVLEHAANAIRGKIEPTRTSAIYEGLPEEVRALIRGKEPKGNLSAMLFHSPAFVSHGRSGWTLAGDGAANASAPSEIATDPVRSVASGSVALSTSIRSPYDLDWLPPPAETKHG